MAGRSADDADFRRLVFLTTEDTPEVGLTRPDLADRCDVSRHGSAEADAVKHP